MTEGITKEEFFRKIDELERAELRRKDFDPKVQEEFFSGIGRPIRSGGGGQGNFRLEDIERQRRADAQAKINAERRAKERAKQEAIRQAKLEAQRQAEISRQAQIQAERQRIAVTSKRLKSSGGQEVTSIKTEKGTGDKIRFKTTINRRTGERVFKRTNLRTGETKTRVFERKGKTGRAVETGGLVETPSKQGSFEQFQQNTQPIKTSFSKSKGFFFNLPGVKQLRIFEERKLAKRKSQVIKQKEPLEKRAGIFSPLFPSTSQGKKVEKVVSKPFVFASEKVKPFVPEGAVKDFLFKPREGLRTTDIAKFGFFSPAMLSTQATFEQAVSTGALKPVTDTKFVSSVKRTGDISQTTAVAETQIGGAKVFSLTKQISKTKGGVSIIKGQGLQQVGDRKSVV